MWEPEPWLTRLQASASWASTWRSFLGDGASSPNAVRVAVRVVSSLVRRPPETDGALDAANKRLFVQMMRKAIAIGHFGQQIFISQSPELWAMADTAIDVTTL